MDPELVEYLKSMEGRVKYYIDHAIDHVKDEMIAASRDMQTETLRYIANIAEAVNTRMRHLEANAGNFETVLGQAP